MVPFVTESNYNCFFALHFFCMRGKLGEPSEARESKFTHTYTQTSLGKQE